MDDFSKFDLSDLGDEEATKDLMEQLRAEGFFDDAANADVVAAATTPRPRSADPDALLTAEQVASLLNVTTQRVWALSRADQIPTVRLGKKTLRYRRSALETWLAAIETTAK